ncbi:methylated-DNA--[protein]-cysteine S-methyltransferase [Luteococcus sp. Sow4_B9]|uniref:methylated-DNA--[protein]-cysteine S-methyltransferase n=1 Tax=Luteococcus sp. Sow4_B9 TaxID=3438792 RepID=UPI003F9DFADD
MDTSADLRRAIVGSTLGPLTLVAEGDFLVGLFFDGHRVQPERAERGVLVDPSADPLFLRAAEQLAQYFAGERTEFSLPLRPDARNDLDPRVWEQLQQIPFGQTVTYGQIAEALGERNLAQPVGGAVGRNPLSIVVPCHRVVGASGKLTGFAGGEARKAWLLDHEAYVAGHSLLPPSIKDYS